MAEPATPLAFPRLATLRQTPQLPDRSKAALERLIRIAQTDTGQARYVANFLLAWWNAGENGGFDLTDLWAVDAEIAQDLIVVFGTIPAFRHYPDSLGYKSEFKRIWDMWRGKGGAA